MVWQVIEAVESVAPQIWGASAVAASDMWLLFGGVDVTQCREQNTLCAWHFEKGEWRWLEGDDAPPRRSMHTAVRFGDRVVVFGGATDVSSTLFNDLHELDLFTGKWAQVTPKGDVPMPRYGHTACVVRESMYVFGGIDHAFLRSHRVWSMNLRTRIFEVVGTTFSPIDLLNIAGLQAPEPDPPRVLSQARSLSPSSPAKLMKDSGTSPMGVRGQHEDVRTAHCWPS